MNEEPTNPTTAQIVENYFRFQKENDESLFWAWEAVDYTVSDDPEEGWKLIQELLRCAQDKKMIAHVAAGPLETLLYHTGRPFIDRIKSQAKQDKRLLYALSRMYTPREYEAEFEILLKGIDFENFDPFS